MEKVRLIMVIIYYVERTIVGWYNLRPIQLLKCLAMNYVKSNLLIISTSAYYKRQHLDLLNVRISSFLLIKMVNHLDICKMIIISTTIV